MLEVRAGALRCAQTGVERAVAVAGSQKGVVMKKLTRWQLQVGRMIDDVVLVPGSQSPRWYDVEPREIVNLLSRNHVAVVRKVRQLHDKQPLLGDDSAGYWLACDDLLAWLKARGK